MIDIALEGAVAIARAEIFVEALRLNGSSRSEIYPHYIELVKLGSGAVYYLTPSFILRLEVDRIVRYVDRMSAVRREEVREAIRTRMLRDPLEDYVTYIEAFAPGVYTSAPKVATLADAANVALSWTGTEYRGDVDASAPTTINTNNGVLTMSAFKLLTTQIVGKAKALPAIIKRGTAIISGAVKTPAAAARTASSVAAKALRISKITAKWLQNILVGDVVRISTALGRIIKATPQLLKSPTMFAATARKHLKTIKWYDYITAYFTIDFLAGYFGEDSEDIADKVTEAYELVCAENGIELDLGSTFFINSWATDERWSAMVQHASTHPKGAEMLHTALVLVVGADSASGLMFSALDKDGELAWVSAGSAVDAELVKQELNGNQTNAVFIERMCAKITTQILMDQEFDDADARVLSAVSERAKTELTRVSPRAEVEGTAATFTGLVDAVFPNGKANAKVAGMVTDIMNGDYLESFDKGLDLILGDQLDNDMRSYTLSETDELRNRAEQVQIVANILCGGSIESLAKVVFVLGNIEEEDVAVALSANRNISYAEAKKRIADHLAK